MRRITYALLSVTLFSIITCAQPKDLYHSAMKPAARATKHVSVGFAHLFYRPAPKKKAGLTPGPVIVKDTLIADGSGPICFCHEKGCCLDGPTPKPPA